MSLSDKPPAPAPEPPVPPGTWLFFPRPIAWAVLVITLAASAGGWFIAWKHAESEARKQFDEEASRIASPRFTNASFDITPIRERPTMVILFNWLAVAICGVGFGIAYAIAHFMFHSNGDGLLLIIAGPLVTAIDLTYRLKSEDGHWFYPCPVFAIISRPP